MAKDQQGRNKNVGLADRITALRNLPAFFRLVWWCCPRKTLFSFLLRLVRSAMPVVMLYIGKLIIDQVIFIRSNPGTDTTHLWQLIGLEFALAILTEGLNRLIGLLDHLLGETFANYTSIKIMKHAATLDLEQLEDSEFYDKLERARQQTVGRTMLLSQAMSQMQDLISIGFLVGGLISFNPWLILLLIIAIIPAFLGESHFNNRNYTLARRQTPERRELDYLRYLGASDNSAKEVKIFSLSGFIIGRFRQLADKFYAANSKIAVSRAFWGTFFSTLGSVGYYIAYIFIIVRTINGTITIGDLTFLAGSFIQLRSLTEAILLRFSAISQGAIYLDDFMEFFMIRPKIVPVPGQLPFPKEIMTGFTFENVGFKYRNSETWANRYLSFTLHPGEKLALVGENGAGKTTLVKLLTRLYDPTEGRILLEGKDLKEYDLSDLRKNLGVIFQDYIQYQMTFSQNIGIGNIEEVNNDVLVRKAAQESLADKIAERLPGKYNQQLGKRFHDGVELSGGEWQKIALSRIYMKDAQLLILDEPTAALDARSEYEVFRHFARMTEGKSAVLISHRFSTARLADRILVLDRGQILEIGTHEELLDLNGRYAELFNLQARGYQ